MIENEQHENRKIELVRLLLQKKNQLCQSGTSKFASLLLAVVVSLL